MTIPQTRYTSVAIILHWVMALAFLAMLASGVVMEYVELSKQLKFKLFQWHKSLGVLVLVAAAVRLFWRLLHKAPALPASIKGFEALAAKAGHWVLYALMIALPVSGWAAVSSSSYGLPTIVFGWFEWPHIPWAVGNETVHDLAEEAHWILALVFGLCLIGHVGAVIRHAVTHKEQLIKRMWWSKTA